LYKDDNGDDRLADDNDPSTVDAVTFVPLVTDDGDDDSEDEDRDPPRTMSDAPLLKS